MAANRKLTPLLAGRTIQAVNAAADLLSITFTDGSILKIKTAEQHTGDDLTQRTVQKIRQKDVVLNIDFQDDSTATIRLAEPMSCVMLRDATGALEYAD